MRILVLFLCLIVSSCLLAQEEHYIKDGENTIHLTTYGAGEPILIINGGPGMSSEGFRGLATILGKTNQAIIYDQRGTGASTMKSINSVTITMDAMVADIEVIRKHLKIEKWVILGHSFGGMLASYYTSYYPDRTKGLILSSSGGLDMELFSEINIPARLTEQGRDSLNYWTRKIANGDSSYNAKLQRGKHLAPAYLYNKTFVPVVAERLTQGNMIINSLVFQDLRRIGFNCKPDLKNYKNPVLIIQGAHDIIPQWSGEKTHQLFPNSKLVMLDNTAHYGWLEQPELYFKNVFAFLKRADS